MDKQGEQLTKIQDKKISNKKMKRKKNQERVCC